MHIKVTLFVDKYTVSQKIVGMKRLELLYDTAYKAAATNQFSYIPK